MKQTLRTLLLLLLLTAWGSIVSAADAANTPPIDKGLVVSKVSGALETTTIEFYDTSMTIIEGEEAEEGKYDSWSATVCDEVGYSIEIRDGEMEYSYGGDDIFEYFSTSTGDFTVKKGSFGTATVTAKYKGNNFYAPSEGSYTVTYREYRGTLTFSATQVDVFRGEEASFTAPTLTCRGEDGEEHNFSVNSYTSSDESVATVDDDGNVTILKYGTTTIGVEVYDYDSERDMTASYTLNYKIPTELVLYYNGRPDFDDKNRKTTGMANDAEWVDGIAYLPYADGKMLDSEDWGDKISFNSQDPSVVDVNEDGYLRFMSGGTTTITITYAGTDKYAPATVSYTAECIDPTVQATLHFNDPSIYGYGVSGSESHAGDIEANAEITHGHFTIVCPTETGETPNRFYCPSGGNDDAVLELHAGTWLSISTGDNTRVSSVTAHGTKDGEDIEITDWTIGNDKSIATVRIDEDVCLSSLDISYHLRSITIDENDRNSYNFLKNNYNNLPVNANLKRTLVGGKWNTFSLPFDVEIKGSPLEGAVVKKFGSVKGNVIYFDDADRIKAGYPYLVKPAETIADPTFQNVVIKPVNGAEYYEGENPYYFIGNVTPLDMTVLHGMLYNGKFCGVTSEGKLARINNDTTVKGMRAIFLLKNSATATLCLDSEPTGINGIETTKTPDGKVYNLEGQYVGDSLDTLPGGIYIVDGKKIVK